MISPERRWLVPAWIQGGFYFATGLWPLLEIDSFMWVTGPKADVWLVRTVGGLLALTGGLLLWCAGNKRISPAMIAVALGQAAFLIVIDCIYAGLGRIDAIYVADAVAELGLLALWVWALYGRRHSARAAGAT